MTAQFWNVARVIFAREIRFDIDFIPLMLERVDAPRETRYTALILEIQGARALTLFAGYAAGS